MSGQVWSPAQAREWYDRMPWLRGANYLPADCPNRIAFWQELDFEKHLETMDREMALMQTIGYNSIRVILEFIVWDQQHDGFLKRFERVVSTAAKYGVSLMVCFGNDCTVPKDEKYRAPELGPQPCDWGYHGGRKKSQHGSFPDAVGYTCVDDPELREKFFAMCEEIMTKYRADPRILFWNVWNEPGSGRRTKPEHVALVRRIFELGWKIDPVQPLAADVWQGHYGMSPKDANKSQLLAGELSDIISYHCYGDYETQVRILAKLRRHYGRPLVNTEWLARIKHNDVFTAYPLYYIEGVGCTCWGFVAGKYQTYEPWEFMWTEIEKGSELGKSYDMTKWFHDLYRPSLRPYDPKEIDIIKRFNKLADEDFKNVQVP